MSMYIQMAVVIDARKDVKKAIDSFALNWPEPVGDEVILNLPTFDGNPIKVTRSDISKYIKPSAGEKSYEAGLYFGTGGGQFYYETDGKFVTFYWMSGVYPRTLEDYLCTFHGINELLKKVIPEINPAIAITHVEGNADFEYYGDSSYFATPWFEHSSQHVLEDWVTKTNALPIVKHDLKEVRRLITVEEIKAILKKIAPSYIEHDDGIGVWRFDPNSDKMRENTISLRAYPHTAVRQELLKRGADLYFGPTETGLLHELEYPQDLLKLGVINAEQAKKLAAANKKFDEQHYGQGEKEFEEKWRNALNALSKEEKHGLGLDLPKFGEGK